MSMVPGTLELLWTGPVFLLAVTGGIASGKSAFCRFAEGAGAFRLDADEQAKKALESPELSTPLRDLFGDSVLPEGGPVDRAAIAAVVFREPTLRKKLEALIHPVVRRKFREAVSGLSEGSILVYDVPLVFEANLASDFNLVVVVSAPVEEREARALRRNGWSQQEFMARERAQMPLSEKEKRADLVIRNHGSEADLREMATDLVERIRNAYPRRTNP